MSMAAVPASRHMAAERRRAAVLDRRHHLELAETQMADVGTAPGGSMGAEDTEAAMRADEFLD